MGMMKHIDIFDRVVIKFKGRVIRVYVSMTRFYEGMVLGRSGSHLIFLNMGEVYFVCHIPFEDIKCFSTVLNGGNK